MRKITDKKELVKLCSYIIMGDGGVYKSGKGNTNFRFSMNMIESNRDYIELCKDILENITSCSITERLKEGNRNKQLNLQSKVHPFFTKLRDRIYTDNYKGIDPHALKLLDYEALSFLYMSDGCLSMKRNSVRPSITLNMCRLSYGDLFILKKALKEKLDLEWNINRTGKYYYLVLRVKDHKKFITNISKYITPSFNYKILYTAPFKEDEGDDIV